MKYLLIIILTLPLYCFGQSTYDSTRIIRGYVFDKETKSALIGVNVLEYKTPNGAVVGPDGYFEMTVSKSDTVLISIPFCFESYYVYYMPTENFKRIIINEKLRKESRKIIRRLMNQNK